jgi:hypothetical protein
MYQNPQNGSNLEGLGMETVGTFCDHLESLRQFGTFCGIFFHFGILYQDKSGNTDLTSTVFVRITPLAFASKS